MVPKKPKRKIPEAMAKAAKATQFKKGHKPANRNGGESEIKPWSYRNEFRYVACQNFDPDNLERQIKKMMRDPATKMAKGTRMIALQAFLTTFKKMDSAMLNTLIENTEGKLTQTLDLPPFRPAPTKFKDAGEAAAAYQEFIKQ